MGKTVRLQKIYNKVVEHENQMMCYLAELSERASEIYGKDVEASVCSDGEIEFRLPGDEFYVELTIEELLEMESEQQGNR